MINRGCVADAFLDRFGAVLECQMVDFGNQNHKHITDMVPEIDPKSTKTFKISPKPFPKSMKNRVCVADAFLERFWSARGANWETACSIRRSILGAIFDEKSKKWHPKRHPQIDAEKVSENDEKRLQNDAKMDAQIDDLSYFFEKGEKS